MHVRKFEFRISIESTKQPHIPLIKVLTNMFTKDIFSSIYIKYIYIYIFSLFIFFNRKLYIKIVFPIFLNLVVLKKWVKGKLSLNLSYLALHVIKLFSAIFFGKQLYLV